MTNPQEISRLVELRERLNEVESRRHVVKAEINRLYDEERELAARSCAILVSIDRLGGGFDTRGLREERSTPQRFDGRGSWIDA